MNTFLQGDINVIKNDIKDILNITTDLSLELSI